MHMERAKRYECVCTRVYILVEGVANKSHELRALLVRIQLKPKSPFNLDKIREDSDLMRAHTNPVMSAAVL